MSDFDVLFLFIAQIYLYYMVKFNAFLQYLLWVGFPLLLITFSVGFVHLVSPHAIGKCLLLTLYVYFVTNIWF